RDVSNFETAIDELDRGYDIVISNQGGKENLYAYRILDQIERKSLALPLVIYGSDPEPLYAKEAQCHGAVARAISEGTLFAAVIRAIGHGGGRPVSDDVKARCFAEGLRPFVASTERPQQSQQNAATVDASCREAEAPVRAANAQRECNTALVGATAGGPTKD